MAIEITRHILKTINGQRPACCPPLSNLFAFVHNSHLKISHSHTLAHSGQQTHGVYVISLADDQTGIDQLKAFGLPCFRVLAQSCFGASVGLCIWLSGRFSPSAPVLFGQSLLATKRINHEFLKGFLFSSEFVLESLFKSEVLAAN